MNFLLIKAKYEEKLARVRASMEAAKDDRSWINATVALSDEATYVEVLADLESLWPDTGTLVMPRNHQDADADPVLDVLAEAIKPWGMGAVFNNLRLGGMEIPSRAEAEMAVALHYMLGFALRHGPLWRREIVKDLRERQARGLLIAVGQLGFSPVLDS